ncbi:hypothetical protein SDC9_138746 [bioreactor metagenome]|uniref:Amidophosphoribosyltransferase n=1 Tax=bioreactor metagenome TaxID=1076179 RepID=A0A645DQR6_9ZZZZ
MKQAVGKVNPAVHGFEASCFDGEYITGDISDGEINAINAGRNEQVEDDEDATLA